ncbi:MAG: hypothetical protein V9G12_19580 [Microthrixaceae bacterium]
MAIQTADVIAASRTEISWASRIQDEEVDEEHHDHTGNEGRPGTRPARGSARRRRGRRRTLRGE